MTRDRALLIFMIILMIAPIKVLAAERSPNDWFALPTVIGTTFSVEVGLVMVGLLRSDVVGVEMTATGRLGTRDRNSGIVGAMLLPLGFHREAALLMPPRW